VNPMNWPGAIAATRACSIHEILSSAAATSIHLNFNGPRSAVVSRI
jgi:hypothetical protein